MAESVAYIQASKAKAAASLLGKASATKRSYAIHAAAQAIRDASQELLAANEQDLKRAQDNNMPAPLQDRLLLSEERLEQIAKAMDEIADQPDPLNKVVSGSTLESGIRIEKITVPMGVVAIIYEARPNVTADAIALCLRSGNACVLRGGSAAKESCLALVKAIRRGIAQADLPENCACYIDSDSHDETLKLMNLTGLVDVLIPRGGASLIKSCVEHSKVPVIETGTGNCHIYINKDADSSIIAPIVVNAKCQRPGVCNACESLLVDEDAADRLLPYALTALAEHGVELVGDSHARAIAHELGLDMGVATEQDWATEYLDLKISVKCVLDIDDAITHINTYGTGHSESILTENYHASEQFLAGIDAAAVYVNTSTRFTDGGVFGLGGEIGISTQKLHARGPMGAQELTTTKYLIRGEGQVR